MDNSLPSLEEWTKDSYVKAKFYKSAGRIEQVLAIDKELALYCATEEEFKNKSVPFQKPKKKYPLLKLDSCFNMLKLVKEHITKKPTSDRRDAVLRLGKRIVNVIASLQEDLATGTCRLSVRPKNIDRYKV